MQAATVGWQKKTLSMPDKIVLIKLDWHHYPLPSFEHAKLLCQSLISSKAKWETCSGEQSGLHLMSWKKVCLEYKLEGLNIKTCKEFHETLLAKPTTKLVTSPNNKWVMIIKSNWAIMRFGHTKQHADGYLPHGKQLWHWKSWRDCN